MAGAKPPVEETKRVIAPPKLKRLSNQALPPLKTQNVGLNIEDVDNDSPVSAPAVENPLAAAAQQNPPEAEAAEGIRDNSTLVIAKSHSGKSNHRMHQVVTDESILPVGYAQEVQYTDQDKNKFVEIKQEQDNTKCGQKRGRKVQKFSEYCE